MNKNKKLKIGGPLKKAADKLNAAALPGERLAYITPEEARMLKAAGGAGLPINESGVESYWAWLLPAVLGAIGGSVLANQSKEPQQPKLQATTREGMEAETEMFPIQQRLRWAAQEGTKGSVTIGGKETPYDFTGMGWRERQAQLTEQEEITANARAKLDLQMQQQYGSSMTMEALQRYKEMNPLQWDLKQKAGEAMLEQLAMRGEMDTTETEQAVRGAQTARGGAFGRANIKQEVKATYQERQAQLQRSIAMAQQHAMGVPVQGPGARFAPGQTGYAPQPLGLTQQSLNFAQQGYSTAAQNYSNPWMEGLGMVAGMASSHLLAGGGMPGSAPATPNYTQPGGFIGPQNQWPGVPFKT